MRLTKATMAKLAVPPGKSELIVFDEDLPGFGLRLRAGGSAVWIAQYRVGAKQRRVTLGRTAVLDPDRARKAAREVLAKAGLGMDAQAEQRDRQAKAAVTFGAIVQGYLKAVEGASKTRTQGERRRHLLRDWQPFHARPIDAPTRRDVAARLQVLADEHGPIASNRARAALSAFYGWAIGRGHADTNPVIGTDLVGIERSRERVLSADDIRSVWAAAGEDDHARDPEAAAAHRSAPWRGRRDDLGRARTTAPAPVPGPYALHSRLAAAGSAGPGRARVRLRGDARPVGPGGAFWRSDDQGSGRAMSWNARPGGGPGALVGAAVPCLAVGRDQAASVHAAPRAP